GSARASVNTLCVHFCTARMCLFGTFWQCKIYRVLVQKKSPRYIRAFITKNSSNKTDPTAVKTSVNVLTTYCPG
ncbi:hypothetical protein, partial [Citrobacter freundii]|uniref:hypothetical protein n=1 Tax=Citrobacter freundii TaxID=546 RepID=UPI001BCB9F9F